MDWFATLIWGSHDPFMNELEVTTLLKLVVNLPRNHMTRKKV